MSITPMEVEYFLPEKILEGNEYEGTETILWFVRKSQH